MSSGRSSRIRSRVASDVLPRLRRVAELEEPAGAHAVRLERARGRAHLVHRRALVHGVEDLLRARLDAEPHLLARRPRPARARPAGVIRSTRHWIMNGMRASRAVDLVGERARSTSPSRPKMSSANQTWSGRDLAPSAARISSRHAVRRALRVAPPEHRLRAPVAAVRAAARASTMFQENRPCAPRPGAAVGLDVHEVPRGQRQGVEVARRPRAARRDASRRPRPAGASPATVVERAPRLARPRVGQLGQRRLRLAEQHRVGAGAEIDARDGRRRRSR